jgi:hypothetical protein
MPGSRELKDCRLTGIFMGWEVPGIFDVELQVRDLSVVAIPMNALKQRSDGESDHLTARFSHPCARWPVAGPP